MRTSARVNSCVERGTGRLQADFDYFVSCKRVATAAMNFAHGFSGEQAQFDGANYFLRVGSGNARGRFGIEPLENAVQMLRAVKF